MKAQKQIPLRGIFASVLLFALQYALYRLANFLSPWVGITPWSPALSLDALTPQVPFFTVIYVFSYVFWLMGPVAVSLTSKRNFAAFVTGQVLACLAGFLVFTFLPTYMNRVGEGLYASLGADIFSQMLKIVYNNDGGVLAYNLFPSFHCLVSTYCYLGVRRQDALPKGYRVYTLVMAALICVSTLLTRQHYLLDLVSGVLLAIVTDSVTRKLHLGRWLEKICKGD